MAKIELNSWREFEQEIERIRAQHRSDNLLISRLLFRGQSDSKWQLRTTLERHRRAETTVDEYLKIISYLQPEIETFTQNRWETPEYESIIDSFADYQAFHMSLFFTKCTGTWRIFVITDFHRPSSTGRDRHG